MSYVVFCEHHGDISRCPKTTYEYFISNIGKITNIGEATKRYKVKFAYNFSTHRDRKSDKEIAYIYLNLNFLDILAMSELSEYVLLDENGDDIRSHMNVSYMTMMNEEIAKNKPIRSYEILEYVARELGVNICSIQYEDYLKPYMRHKKIHIDFMSGGDAGYIEDEILDEYEKHRNYYYKFPEGGYSYIYSTSRKYIKLYNAAASRLKRMCYNKLASMGLSESHISRTTDNIYLRGLRAYRWIHTFEDYEKIKFDNRRKIKSGQPIKLLYLPKITKDKINILSTLYLPRELSQILIKKLYAHSQID